MSKFSKRELEILNLQKEGVKTDKVIAGQLGIKNPKQVAVHRTNARRKVVRARKFYLNAMKEFGAILFPGAAKKYKD
jgi:sRNA-binding carbon storage regulator CsrA